MNPAPTRVSEEEVLETTERMVAQTRELLRELKASTAVWQRDVATARAALARDYVALRAVPRPQQG